MDGNNNNKKLEPVGNISHESKFFLAGKYKIE